MYICLYESKRDGLSMRFSSVIVSLMLPYSCLRLRICNA